MIKLQQDYVRSVLFGIEDSLVSTTGVIAGVSAGSHNPSTILLAASVTIIVEALSMGAGQFLSERTVHQLDNHHSDNLLIGSSLMIVSYFVAGFIPIIPVLLFTFPTSVYISVGCALVGLFILGYFKGKVVRTNAWRSGLEVLVIGGAATILGALVGWLFRTF